MQATNSTSLFCTIRNRSSLLKRWCNSISLAFTNSKLVGTLQKRIPSINYTSSNNTTNFMEVTNRDRLFTTRFTLHSSRDSCLRTIKIGARSSKEVNMGVCPLCQVWPPLQIWLKLNASMKTDNPLLSTSILTLKCQATAWNISRLKTATTVSVLYQNVRANPNFSNAWCCTLQNSEKSLTWWQRAPAMNLYRTCSRMANQFSKVH